MPFAVQRTHLVAAGALAVASFLAGSRGPWSAQAAPANISQVPQQVTYVDQFGRPLTIAPATAMGVRPLTSPVEPAYDALPQPRPYLRPVSAVRTSSAPRVVRASERGRSWKKSALIIGGSAGTGAGVGALIGGKKGAAIGAAIGGGGAALYEAVKR